MITKRKGRSDLQAPWFPNFLVRQICEWTSKIGINSLNHSLYNVFDVFRLQVIGHNVGETLYGISNAELLFKVHQNLELPSNHMKCIAAIVEIMCDSDMKQLQLLR